MATYTSNHFMTITSDADFRAWAEPIGLALASFGWIKTADTGQIAWPGTYYTGTAAAVYGYEIWRMNDALQATVPVFMKIEYGSGVLAASPSLWFTFGTGSNGAGTLTGSVSTRVQRTMVSNAAVVNHLFSGDTSRFTMCLGYGYNLPAQTIILNIERLKDAAGVNVSTGYHYMHLLGSTAAMINGVITPTGIATAEVALVSAMPGLGVGASGSNIPVFPIFPVRGVLFNPIVGFLGYGKNTIAAGTTFSMTYYGGAKTYTTMDSRVTIGSLLGAPVNGSLLMAFH